MPPRNWRGADETGENMSKAPTGSGERLVHLIKLIASGPHSFSLREFATRAALPVSSVHRLLKILENSGFVERGAGQTYRPGRELNRIASQLVSRFDLARSARPLLQDLVDRFHETAVLCAYSPSARRAVVAEVVLTPHPLRFNIEAGLEISLPWGSLGRAVLAFLPKSEIEMVLRSEHAGPLTGRPRPARDELDTEFDQIREHRFARYCEPQFDLAGVAAPVFGGEDVILGSLGVIMPSARFPQNLETDLVSAVRGAAEDLSEQAAISHS
jgi:DNA-binding IclR family transcriptional regulator